MGEGQENTLPLPGAQMTLPTGQGPNPIANFLLSSSGEGAMLLFRWFSFCFVVGRPGFQGLAQECFLCTE